MTDNAYLSAAEKAGLETLPVTIGDGPVSNPFSRGPKVQKYRPADLGKPSNPNGSRNAFFATELLRIRAVINRPIPYAFRTQDGAIRSLDAGCLGFLSKSDPPGLRLLTNTEGYIVAVEPTEALRHQHGPGQTDRPLGFDPAQPLDERRKAESLRAIREGAQEFRAEMMRRWKGRCALSGEDVPDVLEAAHIFPYGGRQTNLPENGLLLRADLHRLFDGHRLSLRYDGGDLIVSLSHTLRGSSYANWDGHRLVAKSLPAPRPHPDVVAQHHRAFLVRETAGRSEASG